VGQSASKFIGFSSAYGDDSNIVVVVFAPDLFLGRTIKFDPHLVVKILVKNINKNSLA